MTRKDFIQKYSSDQGKKDIKVLKDVHNGQKVKQKEGEKLTDWYTIEVKNLESNEIYKYEFDLYDYSDMQGNKEDQTILEMFKSFVKMADFIQERGSMSEQEMDQWYEQVEEMGWLLKTYKRQDQLQYAKNALSKGAQRIEKSVSHLVKTMGSELDKLIKIFDKNKMSKEKVNKNDNNSNATR